MVNVIGTASELGYLNVPENTLIDIEQMKNYPDEQTGVNYHRKPGRVHGGSVPHGSQYAPESADQTGRYRYFQFQCRFPEMKKRFPT